MKQPYKSDIVKLALHLTGILLCILPPAACTLYYFPFWRESNEETVIGGVLLLLILSAIPFFKYLKKCLSSVASYVMWLILFLLFFFLSRIADEMTVISLFGFIGNLLGAICFKIKEKRVTGDEKRI